MDWVIKVALDLRCDACERYRNRPPVPVASTATADPLDILNIDGFDWVHPVDRSRVCATLMVDEGSSKAVGVVHKVFPKSAGKQNTGNTTVEEAWSTVLKHWVSLLW